VSDIPGAPFTRIRLRMNEADAKELYGMLDERRRRLVIIRAKRRDKGKNIFELTMQVKRVTRMAVQLRDEMVLVGWLPPEEAPIREEHTS
jgi:hypothetical protein